MQYHLWFSHLHFAELPDTYYVWRLFWKFVLPILLCWHMTPEVDVGGTALEFEPSCQYSAKFYCQVTDGSRGAVWQNGVWCGSTCKANVCHWILQYRKDGTQWHSSVLAECLWRPNSGCEQSEAVSGVFRQWWQQQWVTSTGIDLYKQSMHTLVHHRWKCIINNGEYVEK